MIEVSRIVWESYPKNVRDVYAKTKVSELNLEYHRARGTWWEYGGTILQA